MAGRIRQTTWIIVPLLFLLAACGPTHPVLPAETRLNPSPTHMPTNPVSETIAPSLPASARLKAILGGSGAVERSLLIFDDLMNGPASAPVDDSAFALPEEAAMPTFAFEGRLQLSMGASTCGFKLIRDDANFAADPLRMQLPDMDLEFVQDGSFLIPVKQGLTYTGSRYWNTVTGPGRIWTENGDHGYARVSFPFSLVERNQNCTHNGVMSFLFDGAQVSQVRYQVSQETCLTFKFDLWGQAPAVYIPMSIPGAAALKQAHAAEAANRLPTKPMSALAIDFPGSGFGETALTSGVSPENMTLYGLVVNGTHYVSACNTRHGQYAYCEEMRLPSYSTAKSAFAAVALMRLGQKYGTGVYHLLIKDTLPEITSVAGDWSQVTFRNALDMATGNYSQAGFEVDEAGIYGLAFLDQSESYTDKIRSALGYPNREPPGRTWVYHTSDTFLLARAMRNYLVQQEGSGADIFNLVRDEVYKPLQLSAGSQVCLRTDNSPTGAPFGGYGLFWNRDDIAKLAAFLNNQDGKIDGVQVLEAGLLAAALQRDPDDRGLDTTGTPVYKYHAGFWAYQWKPSGSNQFTCPFWTPFMSGYGGISVVLMPNGVVYYYFSDNNEFAWAGAVKESNKLRRLCL